MISKNKETIGGLYQLGETLGKGQFGKVYKGLNIQTGETVAIKRIEKEVLNSEQLPSIMHELELSQKLSHPNIVRFVCHFETPESLYFVLELVEGGSLLKTMKSFGVFPESLIVIYMAQALKGLEYLHAMGIIHRDIKSGNILLTKVGKIKLADFGSASYAALAQRETISGTPFWMAPEVIMMQTPTKSSDIWSLGCTIIELLTGYPPYWENGSMSAMFHMVENDRPPLPDDISPDLEDFLKKTFVKDPNQRPSAVDLQTHPWIKSNIKTEEQLQGPKPENVYNTIRQYNTIRTKNKGTGSAFNDPETQAAAQKAQQQTATGAGAGSDASQERLLKLFQENAKLVNAMREMKKQLDLAKKEKQIAESPSKDQNALKKQIEEKLKKEMKSGWTKEWEKTSKKDFENWKKEQEAEIKKDLEEKWKKETMNKYKKSLESKQRKEMENWRKETKEEIKRTFTSRDTVDLAADLCGFCGKPLVDASNPSSNVIIFGTTGFTDQNSEFNQERKWHEKCFACGFCGGALTQQNYVDYSGQCFCSSHFVSLISSICYKCNQKIDKHFIRALDRDWHAECFVCESCKQPLKEYLEKDGMPYCASCLQALLKPN